MGNKPEEIKRYETYGSIISMSDQIGSKKELIQNIYLILTKSIKNFINALVDFNSLSEDERSSENLLEQLGERFAEYDAEKHIEIYYKLEQFEDIIDTEDNEFLIMDKESFPEMAMELKKHSEKMVKLIKKENNFEIRLEGRKEKIILKQIKNGFYKIDRIIYGGEDNNTQISQKEINILQKNDNYTNDISNIVSFLDCLKNISKLKKYFLENKNLFSSNEINKIYSKLFYNYLTTNSIEILIKEFIQDRNDLFNNNKLIECFYDKMHSELNEKENKIQQSELFEGKHLRELSNKCREDFCNNNKSIISDNFYFEEISILHCKKCNKNCYRTRFMNKLVIDVEELRKYKLGKYQYFESLNIIDCLKFFVAQNKDNKSKCRNCNDENLDIINKINSPPEILTIILDYGEDFKNDSVFSIFPKNDDDLSINIDFSIFKWNENDKSKNDIWNYNLIGFCSYYNNDEGKYYRPFYLGENNKWYLHRNKENIEISLRERDQGKPYFLFYQRIDKV